MARKRKTLRHLDYNSQEYWNRLLAEEGLSVDTGRHPKLILVGDSADLGVVEKMEIAKEDHRRRLHGAGPETNSTS